MNSRDSRRKARWTISMSWVLTLISFLPFIGAMRQGCSWAFGRDLEPTWNTRRAYDVPRHGLDPGIGLFRGRGRRRARAAGRAAAAGRAGAAGRGSGRGGAGRPADRGPVARRAALQGA